jgi:hypothetical protein
MCGRCLEDLSRVEPVEETKILDNVEVALDDIDLSPGLEPPLTPPTIMAEEEPVIVYPDESLNFQASDGQTFAARPGEIVGRAATGSDILQNFPTVSRLHFRLGKRDLVWLVKNLSDNGTFINGQEVGLGEEKPLTPGDEISLSSKCRLMVVA